MMVGVILEERVTDILGSFPYRMSHQGGHRNCRPESEGGGDVVDPDTQGL